MGFSFPSSPPLGAFLKIIVWENGSGIKGGARGIFFFAPLIDEGLWEM